MAALHAEPEPGQVAMNGVIGQFTLPPDLRNALDAVEATADHLDSEFLRSRFQSLHTAALRITFYKAEEATRFCDLPEDIRQGMRNRLRKDWERLTDPTQIKCAHCKAVGAAHVCARCHYASYCNTTCQNADWSAGHQHICSAYRVYYDALQRLITTLPLSNA